MFKAKTLFVVGAGASCEVDMPAGYALKTAIADLVRIEFKDGYNQSSGDRIILEALRLHMEAQGQRDLNPLLHKCRAMANSLKTSAESIDNYLYNHSDDSDIELIGKLGIARAILMAEAASKLQGRVRDNYREASFNPSAVADTWFMHLAQMLINQVRKTILIRYLRT